MRITENDRLYYRKIPGLRKNKMAASRKMESRKLIGHGRPISFLGWIARAAVLILLWLAYKEPILNAKDKVVNYFKEHVDMQALRDTAAEKLDELNN